MFLIISFPSLCTVADERARPVIYIPVTMLITLRMNMSTMESLPNEVMLLLFNYLKTYDIVYGFFFLKRRYARLIEQFRPFATSIDLTDASLPVFNLYHSLLSNSHQIDASNVENMKLDCHMMRELMFSEKHFPRLQSLSVIVRRTDELAILLKYFPFFTTLKQLYIRSDVCCCDRISFEEQVKQTLFEASTTKLESLTFATPPCYSISIQDINFERCWLTNLTVS